MSRLVDLQNLGPKSAAMLAAAGIISAGELQRLGAVAAFVKVRQAGARPSLNLLWALQGAIEGVPWQHVAKHHRASLLLALEQSECGDA
jgi:DNA transformation protein and related proteins